MKSGLKPSPTHFLSPFLGSIISSFLLPFCFSFSEFDILQLRFNNHDTRHMSTPPTFLANASLASRTPLDVLTNMHSPTPKP